MDDLSARPDETAAEPQERLSRLSVGEGRSVQVNRRYTAIVRKLRFILPLLAVIMTVIVLTWDEAGKRMTPMKKEDLIPESQNIQNELLKPVFNSVDDKNQPYSVTADRAVQSRGSPDIVELEKPVANLKMNDGTVVDADSARGLYEQKSQKLNLDGQVHLKHSNGYTLTTEELRIDMITRKAYSGTDVFVEGPAGTLRATGLEGDADGGALIFTGPATVILYSDGNLLSPKEKTP